MKVVILAGGLGSRLSEETIVRPKPMVEIGGKPMLWHVMKIYSHYGFNDFIICLGYKGHFIKEWLYHYLMHNGDVTLDLKNNSIKRIKSNNEDWMITLVETGEDTMTGGRIKRIKDYVGNETFMMTYGDGVGDVNIKELIDFHRKHGKIGTVTAVSPPGRFGTLDLKDDDLLTTHKIVINFSEKRDNDGRVSGGFFVLEPGIFDYINGDDTIFEREPLEKLAKDGHLYAYHHDGFWKPMDNLSDKHKLESLWQEGAPWKIWD